ncbi:sel1 repeat family protein, partial [Neisseria meningitidis]|nr:sel1 repeat family protein [Neisseria meningitidis]
MKQTVKWLAAALIALGLNRAVWADDVSDFRENLQAAAQGNAAAQYNLGAMYYKGRGVRRDDAEAVRWYRQAAEQGLAQADDVSDFRENLQAAAQGNAAAQYNLGAMYYKGR